MSNITETQQYKAAQDSATNEFAKLLEESFEINQINEGKIVKGTVVSIESDLVIVDVGLKTEGRISLSEFSSHDGSNDLEIGDQVDVYLERIENALGDAVLSRDKAKREENWVKLEEDQKNNVIVEGIINGKVRGGFTVDINGTQAFLPGSQVDVRPIKDIRPFMNKPQSFHILKMDKKRGNIVVSRKSVLSDSNSLDKSEILNKLDEGQEIEGIVKNITDYGAFIDLGGLDGLLHITDIAWSRVINPADTLNLGEEIEVKVLSFDKEKLRVSLGLKQIQNDPWEEIDSKYSVGGIYEATVSNVTDYGCFAELEQGIEGLIHLSELDWTSKNIHPSKVVSADEQIKVMILEIDREKRRISLGLKQTKPNPWVEFDNKYNLGDSVDGEIKSITNFGIFVGLEGKIDGLIHLSDISEDENAKESLEKFSKGDKITCVIFGIDSDRERISLKLSE